MKGAVWTFVIVLVLSAGALAYNFSEDNETRERVRVVERRVTVDPCKRPRSESCQRRIRLVLRELVRRHPKVLKELGLKPRTVMVPQAPGASAPEGGGSGSPPQGGGPIGRVPPRGDDPPAPPKDPTPDPPPRPGVGLEAPVPVQVCGDLVRVNCG
jgi:hypothetical protein